MLRIQGIILEKEFDRTEVTNKLLNLKNEKEI